MKQTVVLSVIVAIFLSLSSMNQLVAAQTPSTEKLEYKELWALGKKTPLPPVTTLSLHPDGKYIAASYIEDGRIYLIDTSDGKTIGSFASSESSKLDVNDLAWSHNGQFVASALLLGAVEIWSFAGTTLTLNLSISLEGQAYSLRWSPDDKYLAIISENGGETEGSIWNVKTGKEEATLASKIGSIEWKPDSKQLASVDWEGTIVLWDAKSYNSIRTIVNISEKLSPPILWSLDGKQLAISTSEPQTDKCSLQILDTETLKPIKTLVDRGTLHIASYRPGGQLIVGAGYKRLRIWSVVSERVLATLDNYNDLVSSISWNKNGDLLAIGSRDGSIQLLKITYTLN